MPPSFLQRLCTIMIPLLYNLLLLKASHGFVPRLVPQLQRADWMILRGWEDSSKLDSEEDPSSDDMGGTALEVPLPQATPFWTTMNRKRRETEKQLLAELFNGDVVIPEFKKLWFSERGLRVEQLMYQADLGIGLPQKWNLTIDILTQLIEEDPTYLEPYVRLSKLYCLQGRFDESKIICHHVLRLRPWHFVALETIVAVNVAQSNVFQSSLWDSKRLPTPSNVDQRRKWVEKAIQDASNLLEVPKDRHDFFGGSDEKSKAKTREGEDDPWQ